jgi:hypothetical protein
MTAEIVPLFGSASAPVDEPLPADALYEAIRPIGGTREMAVWLLAQFEARTLIARSAFRDAVKSGVDWDVPGGGDPDCVAGMNRHLEREMERLVQAAVAAYSQQLISALVELYIARHPPSPGGGRKVA